MWASHHPCLDKYRDLIWTSGKIKPLRTSTNLLELRGKMKPRRRCPYDGVSKISYNAILFTVYYYCSSIMFCLIAKASSSLYNMLYAVHCVWFPFYLVGKFRMCQESIVCTWTEIFELTLDLERLSWMTFEFMFISC